MPLERVLVMTPSPAACPLSTSSLSVYEKYVPTPQDHAISPTQVHVSSRPVAVVSPMPTSQATSSSSGSSWESVDSGATEPFDVHRPCSADTIIIQDDNEQEEADWTVKNSWFRECCVHMVYHMLLLFCNKISSIAVEFTKMAENDWGWLWLFPCWNLLVSTVLSGSSRIWRVYWTFWSIRSWEANEFRLMRSQGLKRWKPEPFI